MNKLLCLTLSVSLLSVSAVSVANNQFVDQLFQVNSATYNKNNAVAGAWRTCDAKYRTYAFMGAKQVLITVKNIL